VRLADEGRARTDLADYIARFALTATGGVATHTVDAERAQALVCCATGRTGRELLYTDACGAELARITFRIDGAVPSTLRAGAHERIARLLLQSSAGAVALADALERRQGVGTARSTAHRADSRIGAACTVGAVTNAVTRRAIAGARRSDAARRAEDGAADAKLAG